MLMMIILDDKCNQYRIQSILFLFLWESFLDSDPLFVWIKNRVSCSGQMMCRLWWQCTNLMGWGKRIHSSWCLSGNPILLKSKTSHFILFMIWTSSALSWPTSVSYGDWQIQTIYEFRFKKIIWRSIGFFHIGWFQYIPCEHLLKILNIFLLIAVFCTETCVISTRHHGTSLFPQLPLFILEGN